MDSAKTQLVDRLKSANNVLVTVSCNPSVDQLAACLGLTLLLNKLNKHAAAVFSGTVPSTLEFLQPEDTLEKNTDSLRDFIIALDKSKADKLRYKVEDDVVRIFITPYKTSITQDDLEFSQGDFNVDVVVALGVHQQDDLDEAITAHGRILHDATVASINITPDGGLGSINWQDTQASSLSELITDLAQMLGENLLDSQNATALLTGIVAETDRFSNDKTSSQTMNASAALMAAGANQQLIASKLEEEPRPSVQQDGKSEVPDEISEEPASDGTLKIAHKDAKKKGEKAASNKTITDEDHIELPEPQVSETPPASEDTLSPVESPSGPKLVTEPPALGSPLSANTEPERLDPAIDPLSMPSQEPPQLLDRSAPAAPPKRPSPTQEDKLGQKDKSTQEDKPPRSGPNLTPPPFSWTPPSPSQPPSGPGQLPDNATEGKTLVDLEKSVNSPHIASSSVEDARDEVNKAFNGGSGSPPSPIEALNAQPLGGPLHAPTPSTPADNNQLAGLPPGATDVPTPPPASPVSTPQVTDTTAPPPVPPPIPFQFGNSGPSS